MQFLTEAAVLTSLGGIVGVISGIGMAELISRMMQIPVSISVPAIVVWLMMPSSRKFTATTATATDGGNQR